MVRLLNSGTRTDLRMDGNEDFIDAESPRSIYLLSYVLRAT